MALRRACHVSEQLLRPCWPRYQARLRFSSRLPPSCAFTSSTIRSAANVSREHSRLARVSATRHSVRPRPEPAAVPAALAAAISLLFSVTLFLSTAPRTALDAQYASSSPEGQDFDGQPSPTSSSPADNRDRSLPRFRITEIRKHGAKSKNPWIIHGDRVYDITDWVPAHPGGEVILRAAGGSIEPYWDIFTIHKNQYVHDILAQYFIGFVDQADLVDGIPAQHEIEDPFKHDPERDPSLITRTAKPRNAETPGGALSAHFLTPNELFYVRNHMWVPNIDKTEADHHRLTIELVDGTRREYTLEELKKRFPKRKVTAVLQCSGNRRSHMSEESGRKANGLPWSSGAISNASWEGVFLSDVLADAGLDLAAARNGTSEAEHVQFMGLEAYGASIPLKKAVDPFGDVLLAYGMNGKTLPRDHGFPLRAIVPGFVAARSVKWLNRITLSDEESTSQWQRRDYKCFGPNQTNVDWDDAPAIQDMPVQSAITDLRLGKWLTSEKDANVLKNGNSGTSPQDDCAKQKVHLSGYAFSGGGRSVIRVDVSLDGGFSWDQAYLLPDCISKNGEPSLCQGRGSWAWKRWKYDGHIPASTFKLEPSNKSKPKASSTPLKDLSTPGSEKRCTTVVVKATDDSYNTQPESHAATWNIRGNLATAWHRVQVCTDCSRQPQMGGAEQQK